MKKWIFFLVLRFAFLAGAHQFDGSQPAPVHRIPLVDEDGQKIRSVLPNAMPISTKNTCGFSLFGQTYGKTFHGTVDSGE